MMQSCASAARLLGGRPILILGFEAMIRLIRFGIRAFKIKLRQASKHLEELRGPEGEPLPPNTMAELRRDLARLQVIRAQITEIERARLEQLKRGPRQGTNPMIRILTRVLGIGIET